MNQFQNDNVPIKTIQVQESEIKIDQTQLEKLIEASIQRPEGIDLIDQTENQKIEETLNPKVNKLPERLKILTEKAQREEDKKYKKLEDLSLEDIFKGISKTFILLLKKGIYFFDYHSNDPDQDRFIYLGIIIILITLILL